MPDNVAASKIMLMVGGALLFISSIFPWVDLPGASRNDLFGILWLFTLLMGGAVAVVVALDTFGNIELPDEILGFSLNQIYLVFGFTSFVILFGLQWGRDREIGVLIGWLAAAVVFAGAFMELRADNESASPTEF